MDAAAQIIERLDRIEVLLRNPMMTIETPAPQDICDVLTTVQAAAFVNAASVQAFYRWAKRWDVKASGQGRWSRLALKRGLERESRSRVEPRAIQQPRGKAA